MPTIVSVQQGGTGATNAAAALSALGGVANTGGSIAGNLVVSQDLTVSGNLLVEGNTVTLNVSTLEVEDNEIVLNSNTSGAPTLNASITVDRGSSTNTFVRWNETTDKWGWSDDGSTFNTFETSLNAYGQANNAYGQANNGYTQANSAYGQANLAYTQANNAYGQANLAYTAANNRVLKAGDTMTGNLNVSATLITQNVEPVANITYNLGTNTKRFKDLYLSNSTIYLGEATISANGGNVSFGGSNIQLSNVSTKLNVTNDLFISGNVGIGTTNPSGNLHVHQSSSNVVSQITTSYRTGNNSNVFSTGLNILAQATGSSSARTAAFIGFEARHPILNGNHGTSAYIVLSPNTGSNYGNGQFDFYIRNDAPPYAFNNDSSALNTYWMSSLMTIRSDGNVGIGTTSFNSNGGKLQVADGISFPATQSACSDANTLDDYEEGSFDPTFTGETPPTGVTYTARAGRYTKIGRVVFIELTIQLSSKGTGGSGNMLIGNLPFTIASDSTYANFGALIDSLASDLRQVSVQLYPNSSTIYLIKDGGSTTGHDGMKFADITNSTQIRAGFFYTIA